jgi:hypothetical protein
VTATERIDGVVAVRLVPLDGQLVVRYDPGVTSADAVSAAVDAAITALAR